MSSTMVTDSKTSIRSPRKTLAWTIMGFVVALWIFVVFFADGIIGNLIRERLEGIVTTSTHGEYRLSFADFRYHRGTIGAKGTQLVRIGYRASEHGTTMRKLGIDDTRITGFSIWDALFGRPLELSDFRTRGSKIYLCTFSNGQNEWKLLPDTVHKTNSTTNVTLNISNVEIPNILLLGREGQNDKEDGTFSIGIQQVGFNSKARGLPVSAEALDVSIPWIQYSDSSGSYFMRNAHTSSTNSLFTIDTFSYANGTGTTAIRGSGIRAAGLDFIKTIFSSGPSLRAIQARTWAVKSRIYRSSGQSHPSDITWQDKLARSIAFPIQIDSVMLESGNLTLALDSSGSIDANGLRIQALCFDLDSGHAEEPLFSQQFAFAANHARYVGPGSEIEAKSLLTNIQDSLVTVGTLQYSSSTTHNGHKVPITLNGVRAEGIAVSELISGREIAMSALRSTAWNISGLPSSHASSKRSQAPKSQQSIWTMQKSLAGSISMPVRIGRVDLANGNVTIHGGSSPTIDATRAGLQAVDFNLDSAHTKELLFSHDVRVSAETLHFADLHRHNILDMTNGRTSLRDARIVADAVRYVSRSPFEPDYNNSTYSAEHLNLSGIDVPGLLQNKQIAISSASVSSWKIDRKADTTKNPETVVEKEEKPAWNLPIRISHAVLPNGTVIFFDRDTIGFYQTMDSKVTKLDVSHFAFLPPHKKRPRLTFDQVLCDIPNFDYSPLNGFYTAEIRNLHANMHDSIITMDSLGYVPKYSEDEFAAKHTYARGRTDFRLAGVHIVGIDARRMINGGGIIMDSLDAPTLWLDYYKDDRKPSDPNPGPAIMPNDIVRKLNLPFTVQDIFFNDGHIQIRELDKNQDSSGYFTFDSIKIEAYPLTFDSASPEIDSMTRVDMQGVFIAQAPMHVVLLYPLHDSTFNLKAKGTVGPFDLKRLNSYLVPDEHVQVMNGNFYHGDIDLNIQNGTATSYVEPIYNHFKLRVLPPRSDDKRDIQEGVETFIANTFILRDDDPDEKGGPPITATTMLARKPDEEFFQFLWLAIRQSLGTVVGGFK